MDFVTKSFRKDETLTSWTLSQHICPHFWAWLLLYSAITPKSEDKYVVKVFYWSEVHLFEMTLLQNPYFSYDTIIWTKQFFVVKYILFIILTNLQRCPQNKSGICKKVGWDGWNRTLWDHFQSLGQLNTFRCWFVKHGIGRGSRIITNRDHSYIT